MDVQIIRRAIRGDADCFTEAVMAVKDQAYKIAYCYLHHEENSMDAVCNAVEKSFVNIKKLKDPGLFKTWFIRIVINECKQQLRKDKKALQLENILESDVQHANWETAFELEGILEQLYPADRSMIYMKYYLGYTLDEIAELTELPLGTVKTRIYGSLRELRRKLERKEVYS